MSTPIKGQMYRHEAKNDRLFGATITILSVGDEFVKVHIKNDAVFSPESTLEHTTSCSLEVWPHIKRQLGLRLVNREALLEALRGGPNGSGDADCFFDAMLLWLKGVDLNSEMRELYQASTQYLNY